jgi:hypothetical protein
MNCLILEFFKNPQNETRLTPLIGETIFFQLVRKTLTNKLIVDLILKFSLMNQHFETKEII